MQEYPKRYLQKVKLNNHMRHNVWSIVLALSLIVVLAVFWYLKLTGITMAGEAFCGIPEHVHSEECQNGSIVCELTEHIHVESCYSDISADLETSDDWEASFADIQRSSSTAENVVLLARSQLGCGESELNFEVGLDGVRRGITRYGQWYGNPYGDWSAMFSSFCLYYAGVEDAPANAGPESMRLEWDEQGMYVPADEYSPQVGNLIFLNKPAESEAADADVQEYETETTANSVAIIVGVTDTAVTVIEGDVNGAVAEVSYDINGSEIIGYGIVPEVSEFAVFVAAPRQSTTIAKTTSFDYSMLTSSNRFVLYTVYNGTAYAIDGNGNAVQIYVDGNGNIITDHDNPDMLMWSFSRYNNNSTAIQNVGNGRYLHPYYNGATDNGITTPGRWGTTVSAYGSGVTLSHSAYVGFDAANSRFYMTQTQWQNVNFQLGMSTPCTVWLDGTNGGIMSLGGSDNRSYSAYTGGTLTLPTNWKSPDKYNYVLKGWYDINNNKYYAPGETITISGNTVFYADWKAASYDIGHFNSQVDETVSTNSFITTRLFDYGALLNVLSERVNVSVGSTSHSETWELLTSGYNPYNGVPTLNFILRDWDVGNEDISYPRNHNDRNNPTDAGTVYPGLYTETIRDVFFDPDLILPGKEYLGEGDHLFQLCEDTSHDHYGYYYYNSERNAASYNQSEQRFYVYDYLEATRDSINNGDEGKYSDFLPLNSPYENTNGKNAVTYNYNGVQNEYIGTTHYMYDSRYNDNDNSTNNVGANFWFGMSVEIDFYIPNAPGALVVGNEYGNKDVYGKDMHFRFTGDDDVWIFIDDKMVLDLGGLHGRESGDINFSTGEVTVNGVRNEELSNALKSIGAGEHTLTLYYMERGSSMGNCAIYFNLAPRFAFSIQKEDVLTRQVLNGAQFSVYTDRACTLPAKLWTSKESHDNGESSTNTFTVSGGEAKMWGMGAGNVYYIRETKPPDDPNYGFSNGLIRLTFDKGGTASYNVEIIDEGSGVSPGFIVHGFRIDAETQNAYIIATNAPKWVNETTTVEAMKQWNDSLDHSADSVTVYLTVTDPNGTVRRLQEATLNAENNWSVKWTNLPKYAEDGATPIKYSVEEAYVPGYYGTVESVTGSFETTQRSWQDSWWFENGKTYILKNPQGLALSTKVSAEDTGYMWVSQDTAKNSPLALWTASVNGNNVRLTNGAGQTITFYYGNGNPTDFFAYNRHLEDNDRKQYFTFAQAYGGLILRYNNYYMYSSLNGSQKFESGTDASRALVLLPAFETVVQSSIPIENIGFLISNTPLEKETSVTVLKNWVIPPDKDSKLYQEMQITVRLFANGEDTGRMVTLNLKNGWTDVFRGLPYTDTNGNVISYTVQEIPLGNNWVVTYGDIITTGSSPPNYSVTVTNTYRTGGPVLPSTGSPARLMYILCGTGIMLGSLIYGIRLRRRYERRIE